MIISFYKYNNTAMKRELGYIYREPQIIFEEPHVVCGPQVGPPGIEFV